MLFQPWTAAVGFSSPPRPRSSLSPNRHFPVLNCRGVNGRSKQTCVPQSQGFLPFGRTYLTGDFVKGTGQVQSCCSLFFSWEQLLPEAGIVPSSSSTPERGGPQGSVLLCPGWLRVKVSVLGIVHNDHTEATVLAVSLINKEGGSLQVHIYLFIFYQFRMRLGKTRNFC